MMSSGTRAQNYLAAARRFFRGAEFLSKGPTELETNCAFLAAQSLECALKSYLSQTGASEAYLKKPCRRHNLETLWIEASDRGLKVSAQPPNWCVILNQTHDKPYYLRYPIGISGFNTPAVAPMVFELKLLLGLVEAAV